MKHVISLIFLLLVAACSTAQVIQPFASDEEIKKTTEETEEKNSFTVDSYEGIPWLSPKSSLESVKTADGIKAVWTEESLFLFGRIQDDPFIGTALMSWGFNHDRLLHGTQLFVSKDVTNLSLTEELCELKIFDMVARHGKPTIVLGNTLMWQNESTTIQMFCTTQMVVLDWYFTEFLRQNSAFVSHLALPPEVIHEFSKQVFTDIGSQQ